MRQFADNLGIASIYHDTGYSTDPHVLCGVNEAALAEMSDIYATALAFWGAGDVVAVHVRQDASNWAIWRAVYDDASYPILVLDQVIDSAGSFTDGDAVNVKVVLDKEGLEEIARTIPTNDAYTGEVVDDTSIGGLNGKIVQRTGGITLDTLTDTANVAFGIFNASSSDTTIAEVGTTGLNGSSGGSMAFPGRSLAWFTVDQYGWWSVAIAHVPAAEKAIYRQTDTALDLSPVYQNALVEGDNASPQTLTLDDTRVKGFAFEAVQVGAGTLSIAPGTNCTLNGAGSPVALAGQWRRALVYLSNINGSTHEWVICI